MNLRSQLLLMCPLFPMKRTAYSPAGMKRQRNPDQEKQLVGLLLPVLHNDSGRGQRLREFADVVLRMPQTIEDAM